MFLISLTTLPQEGDQGRGIIGIVYDSTHPNARLKQKKDSLNRTESSYLTLLPFLDHYEILRFQVLAFYVDISIKSTAGLRNFSQ